MNLTNHTNSPALNFEGIDGEDNRFETIVCRQTYTWDDTGFLTLSEEQDPLCFADEPIDPNDNMKGTLQESDLCAYKPKCDIIVLGHAYAPYYQPTQAFLAKIQVQKPDFYQFETPIPAPDNPDIEEPLLLRQKQIDYRLANNQFRYQKGQIILEKTLGFQGEQTLQRTITGDYQLSQIKPVIKIGLGIDNSYGGYSYIEKHHPNAYLLKESQRLPKSMQQTLKFASTKDTIIYYQQHSHNPFGKGYTDKTSLNINQSQQIACPQIINPAYPIDKTALHRGINNQLNEDEQNKLVVGFGIRPKVHPRRNKLLGNITPEFIQSNELLPDGFDFAIWNSAFPDQQCDYLKGNEWITLVNLFPPTIKPSKVDNDGNHILTLYLPEHQVIVYVTWEDEEQPSEIPLQIDTVVIQPDKAKVNIVWRITLDSSRKPEEANLLLITKPQRDTILAKYFNQQGEVVRPYLSTEQS